MSSRLRCREVAPSLSCATVDSSSGIGLFSPPFGLGMYATCAIAGTRLQDVAKPYFRYVVVLLVMLTLLIAFPALTIWLPRKYGLA